MVITVDEDGNPEVLHEGNVKKCYTQLSKHWLRLIREPPPLPVTMPGALPSPRPAEQVLPPLPPPRHVVRVTASTRGTPPRMGAEESPERQSAPSVFKRGDRVRCVQGVASGQFGVVISVDEK